MTTSPMVTTAHLDMGYLMSLGVQDQCPKAQRVVDDLADQDFPVQNGEVVGIAFNLFSGRNPLGFLHAARAHELRAAVPREATA